MSLITTIRTMVLEFTRPDWVVAKKTSASGVIKQVTRTIPVEKILTTSDGVKTATD
jgi:hypothetical protein